MDIMVSGSASSEPQNYSVTKPANEGFLFKNMVGLILFKIEELF